MRFHGWGKCKVSRQKDVFLWCCRNSLLMLVVSLRSQRFMIFLFWPRGVFHTQLLTHMPATYACWAFFMYIHLSADTCVRSSCAHKTNSSEAQILTHQRVVYIYICLRGVGKPEKTSFQACSALHRGRMDSEMFAKRRLSLGLLLGGGRSS